MGRNVARAWAVRMVTGCVIVAAGCTSGSTTPEFADMDGVTQDHRGGEDVSSPDIEVWLDLTSDQSTDGHVDAVPDGIADGAPDSRPDGQADAFEVDSHVGPDADAVCVPACEGMQCGDNTCGGSCGQCDPGSSCEAGQCVPIPCEVGLPCDDEDPCTYDDACTDGLCSGVAYVCDDSKECTKDQCDGLGDCIFTIKPGNCLINNVCYANEQLRPDNQCEECITAMSKTEWSKDDTNLCSDGSACTVGDQCSDGTCLAGTQPLTCPDPGPCKSVACVASSGCVISDASGSCDDGNPCTEGDFCESGACQSGLSEKDCSDGNPCTEDSCEPLLECVHTNIPGGCNDGDTCTENDYCDGGTCAGGALKAACNDSNPCTTDSCINNGQCVNQWNSLPCNDGNECTVDDTCDKGQCGGTLRDCDDGKICTNDFCSPLLPGGCYHEDNDLGCEDGNPCTLGDTCSGGLCKPGLGKLNCNDNQECTEDICVPGSGCTHKNLVAFCEDGNVCTSSDYCANGTCVPGGNICGCQFNSDCSPFEDGDKCNGTLYCDTTSPNPVNWACKVDPTTVKTCDALLDTPCLKNTCAPATGLCSYLHVNEGLGCDDGNGCTLNDACLAGSCMGSACSSIGLYCISGACGAQLCTPNTSRCEGNFVKLCNSTGTAEAVTATCNITTQYCAQSGGTAFCAAQICVPNTNICQGNQVMLCDGQGASLTPIQNCATTGQWCLNGVCENLFLCAGVPCPTLAGYTVTCNSKSACEYANADPSGWKQWDVWIYVPKGSFQMGSLTTEAGHQTDESPVHAVVFAKGYFIAKYEIAVAQYEACAAASPTKCTAPSVADWNACGGGVNTTAVGRTSHPQNGLTWQQAENACEWLATDGRLATEAESEYAASGPTHVKYAWGDSPEPTCSNGTVVFSVVGDVAGCGCGTSNTWPVGSKTAGSSWVGAMDLAGNVWEWTMDTYHTTYALAPTDGSAWTGGTDRVIRGGAITDSYVAVRTAERRSAAVATRNSSVGGRCMRPEPSPMGYVVWPVCTPGSNGCNGSKRNVCNAQGTAYTDLDDCSVAGLVCKAGACSEAVPACTGPIRYANGARFTYFESTAVASVLLAASASLLADVVGHYWLGDTTPDPHSEMAPWTYIIDFGCTKSVTTLHAIFPAGYDSFKTWSVYYTTDLVLTDTTNWVLISSYSEAGFLTPLAKSFAATPAGTRAIKIVVTLSSRGSAATYNPDLGSLLID